MSVIKYPKRLIEVDLPIKRISAHARREKYLGTITSLHLWWARRPLAACRAVICGALWPDPADPLCPAAFIDKAREEMSSWTSHERQKLLGGESCTRFEKARQNSALFDDLVQLRAALLDFIADFANPDNSNVPEYLDTSRALTQAAHEALGGAPRYPAARRGPVLWWRLHPSRSFARGRGRICERPQSRPRFAQQSRLGVYSEIRSASRR
ncbi:MAG TPA: DUF1156 domain-containing protein [Chthoniobacterales bacterium]